MKKSDRIARELELSVSSAVENAKDRVEAAVDWAVPRLQQGIDTASPKIQEGLKVAAHNLAGGVAIVVSGSVVDDDLAGHVARHLDQVASPGTELREGLHVRIGHLHGHS